MKVKICPLCDSEMKKSHYCDTCKSFIWRPEILDVHYNAQQRGMGEEDCAYGAEHDQRDHKEKNYGSLSDVLRKTGRTQKTSTSHEEVYGESIQKAARKQRKSRASGSDGERGKRKAGGCLGKIILVIIILNAVLGSIGSNVFNYFTGSDFRYQIQNILDELGIAEDVPVWDHASGDSEEVMAPEIIDEGLQDDGDEPVYSENYELSYFPLTTDAWEEKLSAWANTEYGQPIQKVVDNMEQEYTYLDADDNEVTVPAIVNHYSLGTDQDYIIVYSGRDEDTVFAIDASFREDESTGSYEDHARSYFVMAAMTLDPDNGYDSTDWENELDNLYDQAIDDFDEQQGEGSGSAAIDSMVMSAFRYADGEIWLTFDAIDFQ